MCCKFRNGFSPGLLRMSRRNRVVCRFENASGIRGHDGSGKVTTRPETEQSRRIVCPVSIQTSRRFMLNRGEQKPDDVEQRHFQAAFRQGYASTAGRMIRPG